MKIAIKLALTYVVIGVFAASIVSAAERITTKSLQDVQNYVSKKKNDNGAENILVIFDFDNTLMAMNQDLGSDQWYQWQSELLKVGNRKMAMVNNRAELFDLHYKLFALGKMHFVEKNTVQIVKDIQNMKIKSIVMTSRGYELRNDLETELAEGDLSFEKSAPGPEGGYAALFKPDGIENARAVSYQNGILMGSGQNKGKLLRAFLKKLNLKYKNIIFVDDTLKNIENVEKEYSEDSSVVVFYYTYEEERVKKFEKNKNQVLNEWKKVKPVIEFYKKEDLKLFNQ